MNEADTFPPLLDAWYLTGPTASGKSGVGLELARRLSAEIVSLDSMALYQGMDLGTAKPSAADRAQVPHHLLDLVPPSHDFSLSEYIAAAHRVHAEIQARGHQTLFVGGSSLYLKSLLRGLYPGPPADWEFRRQIEQDLQENGLEALHARLELVDPLAAAKLHPHDKRRIIRALEVFRQTGQPLSHRQTQFEMGVPAAQCHVFVLAWPRADLHARIDERVDSMFARGLVEEVRGLLTVYGALSRTALQAVGYREVVEHLRGDRDLADTISLVKTRTRQFARRQDTWFRSLRECRRVPLSAGETPESITNTILTMGASHPSPVE